MLFIVCTNAAVATSCTPVLAGGGSVAGVLVVVVVVEGEGGGGADVDVVGGAGGSVVGGAGGAVVLVVDVSGVGRPVGGEGSGSDADAEAAETEADDAGDADEDRAGGGAACSFEDGGGLPVEASEADQVRATVSWFVRDTPVTGPGVENAGCSAASETVECHA